MRKHDDVEVGSVVRLNRPEPRKGTGRAMVATDGLSLSLLWEPVAPKPLEGRTRSDFFVTPKKVLKVGGEISDDEIIVPADKVTILLPFEVESLIDDGRKGPDEVAIWKSRADQLLKLGDASAAASYYEEALYVSSNLSIGATSVVCVNGFLRLCEVDCVEDNGPTVTVDATFLDDGEERQLNKSQLLLTLMENDGERLQERVLLNLTRCMLQLADLDGSNRQSYAKAAVLGATIALTVATHGVDELLPTSAQTALTLRFKAYLILSKWKNAVLDVKKLIDVGNKDGKRFLTELERKKQQQQRTTKMLAKEMCKLLASQEG